MALFGSLQKELSALLVTWEKRLLSLPEDIIKTRSNNQNRTIKQIVGHMVDSVSNNTHRIIHLQYQESPLDFPDYANHGNNDRWIAIQNYQEEPWENLVQLWIYMHFHFLYVIENINSEKLQNVWMSGLNEEITLEEMVKDFPRHFKLHLSEINKLIGGTSKELTEK